MDVFILDIGNTFTKGFVFRGETLMDHWVEPTPSEANALIQCAVDILSRGFTEGYDFQRFHKQ